MTEYYKTTGTPSSPYAKTENPTYGSPQSGDPHNPQDFTSIPQSIPSQEEQDTAKYVYNQPGITPGQYGEDGHARGTRRTICGISALLFLLIITLIIIAIAGAVGGGVGGSMAAKDCRNELGALQQSIASSPTSVGGGPSFTSASVSASATAPAGSQGGTITVPQTGCPGSNGSLYTTTFGDKSTTFARFCNSVVGGSDMFQISTPSWDSCMDACVGYNILFASLQTKGSSPACAGVSYVPEWSIHPEYAYRFSNTNTRGSCWLKSSTEKLTVGWDQPDEVVSGSVQP